MNIVITGPLGHIGSRLIRDLSASFGNLKIVLVDNLSTQRYCSLYNLPDKINYRFIEADILKMDLDTIIKKADLVIHLAALTDAANSFEYPEKIKNNNYNGTLRVINSCVKIGCPLIFSSTTSVYGSQKNFIDENCSEEDLNPQSPYALFKLKEENLIKEMSKKYNLSFVIFRFGTIVGVSPGMRFHTAVNKFCWQAVMNQPLTVWKTAMYQKRPYLNLNDACDSIIHIINNQLFESQIYNVVTENLTVDSIINIIKKYVPELNIDYVDSEIMNQLSYDVSNKKFKDTGFAYKSSLENSIKDTINILRNANYKH